LLNGGGCKKIKKKTNKKMIRWNKKMWAKKMTKDSGISVGGGGGGKYNGKTNKIKCADHKKKK